MPICRECKDDKLEEDFPKRKLKHSLVCDSYCRSCKKDRNSQYYNDNREKIDVLKKLYYEKNRGKNKVRDQHKKKLWRLNNQQKIKEWRFKNKEEQNRKANEVNKLRTKTDPMFKLRITLRKRALDAFDVKSWKKSSGTEKLLGGDYKTVMNHIESQFTEGMTWDNHSFYGWHIDHKTPLNSASNEEELVKLFHYTNLQPLWKKDNLSKGCKLDWIKDK